jgi:tRNA pseudouridine38-40 synthase
VPARWTAASLRRALNAVLPPDVWVAGAEEVPLAFHARFDAIARGYVYRIGTGAAAWSPFRRRWCWALGREPDGAALRAAAAVLPGEHSFRAFAKAGQPERGERCVVTQAEWRAWAGGLAFHVTANRFLHHMVRYLVGTMVEIGRGRRPLSDMAGLLGGEGGLETSAPAPPEGLFLTRVYYTAAELERGTDEHEDLP